MLSGTYLKLFLDSAIGKKLIKSTQQGTVVMNISYRDLENIEIPYLTFEKQKEIAQKYTEALTQYNETISSAEEKWQTAKGRSGAAGPEMGTRGARMQGVRDHRRPG